MKSYFITHASETEANFFIPWINLNSVGNTANDFHPPFFLIQESQQIMQK
jgi:hypothetical protein